MSLDAQTADLGRRERPEGIDVEHPADDDLEQVSVGEAAAAHLAQLLVSAQRARQVRQDQAGEVAIGDAVRPVCITRLFDQEIAQGQRDLAASAGLGGQVGVKKRDPGCLPAAVDKQNPRIAGRCRIVPDGLNDLT